jgi:hypothetical protein
MRTQYDVRREFERGEVVYTFSLHVPFEELQDREMQAQVQELVNRERERWETLLEHAP